VESSKNSTTPGRMMAFATRWPPSQWGEMTWFAPEAPEAAHDHVVVQRCDGPFHGSPPQNLSEAALDEERREGADGVEDGPEPQHDEADGVQAPGLREGNGLAVADRGQRDDRHVEGVG
jgi:hypothetical protein